MSKERRMIEIDPGRMSPGGCMTDRIESRGHCCPYCQGNGYHWQVTDEGKTVLHIERNRKVVQTYYLQ